MNISKIIIRIRDSAAAGRLYLDNLRTLYAGEADATLDLEGYVDSELSGGADASIRLSASAVGHLTSNADASMSLSPYAEEHHKYFGRVPTPMPWELPTDFPPFRSPTVARHVRKIRS